jgi:hypothetical protein
LKAAGAEISTMGYKDKDTPNPTTLGGPTPKGDADLKLNKSDPSMRYLY